MDSYHLMYPPWKAWLKSVDFVYCVLVIMYGKLCVTVGESEIGG